MSALSAISETRHAAAILMHWSIKHTFVYDNAKEKQEDKRTFLAENAFQPVSVLLTSPLLNIN